MGCSNSSQHHKSAVSQMKSVPINPGDQPSSKPAFESNSPEQKKQHSSSKKQKKSQQSSHGQLQQLTSDDESLKKKKRRSGSKTSDHEGHSSAKKNLNNQPGMMQAEINEQVPILEKSKQHSSNRANLMYYNENMFIEQAIHQSLKDQNREQDKELEF